MKPLIYKGLRLGTNKTEWVSRDKYQWRCKTIVKNRALDFDIAFIVNNGKVKIVGNKLEGYEHE